MDEMRRKDTVGYKIRLIHNQIHKQMEAKRSENESELALTGMQRWTIGFLKEHEEQTIYQRDLETEFKVSRATASNMLSVMERKGLIERRPVEHDARLKQLVLTERGRAIMERANRDVRQMEASLLAGLSEEEIQNLKETLDKLLMNLGVAANEGTRCSSPDLENHR
ncbi:MAG: MarR family winged helix-turn-helix transcriptional regulator [Roseburia sp.]|nr:MarR family winged helix-turn-helix transcriptional regulator [Roseburia sp.]